MQNKKSLLQRMLVIYITFFVVLIIGLAHSFLPNFSKGYHEGTTLGQNLAHSLASDTPRQIFILGEVALTERVPFQLNGVDTLSDIKLISNVSQIDLTVEQPADPTLSHLQIAFSAIGGNPWFYLLVMLNSLSYLAIIILMFLIIHSIRRSIKDECTLDSRNVWYLRSIGFLTIFSELTTSIVNWGMRSRAAELLADTNMVLNTSFTVSYTIIIMGIMIIFTAEVFAIGQNLSEEQKLTI